MSLEAIPKNMHKHVDKLRGQGIHITDEEAEEVYILPEKDGSGKGGNTGRIY